MILGLWPISRRKAGRPSGVIAGVMGLSSGGSFGRLRLSFFREKGAAYRNLALATAGIMIGAPREKAEICGRSSGVERNLAKVEVVSSNLIARSIFLI